MNEIKIGEIIKGSINLYKKRWKPLLLISLMSTSISLFNGIFNIMIESVQVAEVKILFQFIYMIAVAVGLYFTSRLSVAMIIAANKALTGKELTASHSYEEAKHTTWRYIGIILLMGLMLVIPIMLIVFGVVSDVLMSISRPISGLFIVMGALPAIYIGIIFFFAAYTVVLHPEQSKVFTYSRQLIKGNFFKMLLIQTMPLVILIPLIILSIYQNTNELTMELQIIYTIVQSIASMLLAPFLTLNAVLAMNKIEETRDIIPEI